MTWFTPAMRKFAHKSIGIAESDNNGTVVIITIFCHISSRRIYFVKICILQIILKI